MEELQVVAAPDESVQRVGCIWGDKMGHVLTTSQWGGLLSEEFKQEELDLV